MDNKYVTLLNSNIDIAQLKHDVFELLENYKLSDYDQVSLTSIDGTNDWHASTGKIFDLRLPEKYYAELNYGVRNTIIEKYIKEYSQYYRWRLLKVKGKQTYSVHSDGVANKVNKRIHIPVTTNEHCFMCFYSNKPEDSMDVSVSHYHLQPGNAYEVDTTGFHTAVNYGNTDRYHIVGVRYENSNNRAQ